jgi:hypothetical protein
MTLTQAFVCLHWQALHARNLAKPSTNRANKRGNRKAKEVAKAARA